MNTLVTPAQKLTLLRTLAAEYSRQSLIPAFSGPIRRRYAERERVIRALIADLEKHTLEHVA